MGLYWFGWAKGNRIKSYSTDMNSAILITIYTTPYHPYQSLEDRGIAFKCFWLFKIALPTLTRISVYMWRVHKNIWMDIYTHIKVDSAYRYIFHLLWTSSHANKCTFILSFWIRHGCVLFGYFSFSGMVSGINICWMKDKTYSLYFLSKPDLRI